MIPDELLKRVLEKINKTPATYNHFFGTINNPAWLIPLKEKGFFSAPTPAIREDGYIQFPSWSESGYLLRVAASAPDEVLSIIKDLPDTDNERVMDDVVNALLLIDPNKAAALTEKVKQYVNSSQFLMLGRTAAKFIAQLAEAGRIGQAIGIAEEMLEVMPDPEREEKLKKDYIMIESSVKYRDHDYEEIIKIITPALAAASPSVTIKMYSKLLHNALDYEFTSFREPGEEKVVIEERKDDYTEISRPKIGKESMSHNHENSLISAVRDAALVMMKAEDIDDEKKLDILRTLISDKYTVFKRIAEFVLRDYKELPAFKAFYEELIQDKRLSVILDGEKRGVGEMTSGFVTEKPTNVLKELGDEELIETLKTYKNESGWSFERDSLAKELREMISLDPKRFIPLLQQIATTKNEYLNEAVDTYEELIDSLDEADKLDIIKSLTEVFKQGDQVGEAESREYYSWTKSSAVRFIEKLVHTKNDKTERFGIENANQLLDLLLLLTRDPDPSEDDLANFDPSDLSVNSNRGKAMHALMYALDWLNRTKAEQQIFDRVFEELDWHLIEKNDDSPAIRAVYGWRFEFLYAINEEWAKANIDQVFTEDKLGAAAFNAYVGFNRVHPYALTVLGDVFARQIKSLTTAPDEDERRRHDMHENFVQHLALHYWHNDLGLDEGSILKELIQTADKKYVKELANFIGFRLYKSKDTDVSPEQLTKLQQLWEAIVEQSKVDLSKATALEEFGGWFASGRFDPEWALNHLAYAASHSDNINLDFAALEYLELIAEDYPELSLKALSSMVDGARERWAVSTWSENATNIIRNAYVANIGKSKELATALANKLVAKGYNEYRYVLKKEES